MTGALLLLFGYRFGPPPPAPDRVLGAGPAPGTLAPLSLSASAAVNPLLCARADVAPVLRAALRTAVTLPAGGGTPRLPAGAATSFNLLAGSAMSITSNLSFFRGEDVTLQFQMSPPNTDVTGWSLTFKVATTLGGTVQVTKSVGAGVTILDGPRGVFQVSIASADTAGLAVGRYVWDCRRTDTGSKATVADGYLDLRQEVTA